MKIGFISDIHDDVNTLKEALTKIQSFKCDQLVCLGDIVGSSVPSVMHYLASRNSHETIKLVKSSCDIILAGNHDLYAVQKTPTNGGLYKYPKNWYRLDYYSRLDHFKNKVWHYENELTSLLTREDRLFMLSLPEVIFKEYEHSVKILYSHYAYPDITGSSTVLHNQSRFLDKHFRYMGMNKVSLSFSGHSHPNGAKIFSTRGFEEIAFGSKTQLGPLEKYWINVPAIVNEGKEKSGFAIFNTLTFELEVIKL